MHDNKRGDGQSTAIFRVKVPRTGRYDLRIAYSAHPTRATKVPVSVQSGGPSTKIEFDQTQALPPGEAFRSAGIVALTAEQESVITISNAGTQGFVILDAIQLLEVKE